jgi:hypothetical protein
MSSADGNVAASSTAAVIVSKRRIAPSSAKLPDPAVSVIICEKLTATA